MTQSIPGFNAPAAGFDEPIQLLSACHDKLRSRCDTLSRLPAHIAAHGADEQARSAAQSILRYFDGPALFHHADEEQDLFPALLEAVAGSDAVCMRELFGRLSAEHRQLEAQWQRLRPVLLQIQSGSAAELPLDDVDRFIQEYAAHLITEDEELLPMAQRLLPTSALDQMGKSMHHRRNPD
ncbi:hemerythrin domain-containing protein [Pusillimonas sp. (ex Stolz et al. 2005)]|uniref:hemerythrin domain-containing protein n=1 Tax=Pusillimonas sp. (ex Stolz et al. 2005) TaxID=1979962 RepID=UPI00262CB283|nr:hemerythrin domain-containing protein [Pusillimonas sp. (ex Stolz et al. 2005)]